MQDSASEVPIRPSRLSEADHRPRFAPWQRAWKLETCQLYWLPVSQFPIGILQRRWLLRFQALLAERAKESLRIAPEVFLEMKCIHGDVRNLFIRHGRQFLPLFGMGRHPGQALPGAIDAAYVEDLQKGREKFDVSARQPDYCYWFMEKAHAEQMDLFFGVGGSVTLFLEPEKPAEPIRKPRLETIHDAKMREMVANADLDGMNQQLKNLSAPFLKKSKEMFAGDLKDLPEYPGLMFALPLLTSGDFFEATADAIAAWSSLFPIYLRESPEDGGILLAIFDESFESVLEALLEQMHTEGLVYPA